jgi:hypothetical protein
VPEAIPVTFTVKEHEAFAERVAPERLTLLDPAAAVMVPPPQLPVKPLGVATACPDGKASLKPMPLRDTLVFGFDRLKVRVVVPFNATLPAPNAFAMLGGSGEEEVELPEPPPHAASQTRLTARTRSTAQRDIGGNVRVIGLILLLVLFGHVLVRRLTHLGFRLPIHLMTERFCLVLGFLDLLKQVQLFLSHVCHLKTAVRLRELAMGYKYD